MADPPKILIVDDDEGVRSFAATVLSDLGYAVLTAASGPEALELIAAHPDITLLFTDIVMPEMNGFVLAREAKRIRPDLEILYASGYVHLIDPDDPGPYRGPLLAKPYRPAQLKAEIERVLRDTAFTRDS
jgi:CheY-like chemotaxis protein